MTKFLIFMVIGSSKLLLKNHIYYKWGKVKVGARRGVLDLNFLQFNWKVFFPYKFQLVTGKVKPQIYFQSFAFSVVVSNFYADISGVYRPAFKVLLLVQWLAIFMQISVAYTDPLSKFCFQCNGQHFYADTSGVNRPDFCSMINVQSKKYRSNTE